MIAIATQQLRKSFDGVRAVDDLSIEIEKGKITSLIGPNGAGKTTIINLMTGIMQYDSGKLIINDYRLNKIQSHDLPTLGITRTFQNIRLIEQMSVLDNILVVLTEKGVFASMFESHIDLHAKRAYEILKKVGLWEKRFETAENLSYGQRKLLEIARALATNADIYFLDEPFSGLFKEMLKLVKQIILDLKQSGKTVLLIEHNMDLIRELSDTVIVVDAGALLAVGKPESVLSRKDVIEAYLGE
jgi:ABC-type branched-subunit amino acid transport system ATPase component